MIPLALIMQAVRPSRNQEKPAKNWGESTSPHGETALKKCNPGDETPCRGCQAKKTGGGEGVDTSGG